MGYKVDFTQDKEKKLDQVSERIKKLREEIVSTIPEIFLDRAILITESYEETVGCPYIYRRAKALEKILLNMEICINNRELIVGSYAGKPRGCQLFPEYDMKFVIDELDEFEHRKADKFVISEENKAIAKTIYEKWKGNTITDQALALFPPEAADGSNNLIYLLTCLGSGIGHTLVNYELVLQKGLNGILREVDELEKKLDINDPEYTDKLIYYKSVKIVCHAAGKFAERFSLLALEESKRTLDPTRKAELLKISKICEKVPMQPASSFWEALQSFWFIHLILHLESNGHSVSPGRFDQYMYPYYEKESDKIFCEELIHSLWLKFNEINKVRNRTSSIVFGGYPMFQNIVVGGQTVTGESAVNELSHLCLEATAKVHLPQPSLSIRWFYGCPEDFIRHAVEVVSYGTGMPAMFNDEVVIPNMLQLGHTIEEARNYAIIGCTEMNVPHNSEPFLTGGFLNILKILELTIFNGFDPVSQMQYEFKTGDVENFKTFEDFVEAYYTQLSYYLKLHVTCDNILDSLHGKLCPTPFQSMLIGDCLLNGKTNLEGGARHNTTTLQLVGMANVADSLATIKKLIYEDKDLTWDRLKTALKNNYENDEILRQRIINSVPKYGNDDDYVDLLGRDVLYHCCNEAKKYRSPRNGIYNIAIYTLATNVLFASKVGATPDGRKMGTVLADGGVSCSHGMDKNGLTSLFNSVVKIDPYKPIGSALLNVRLSPSSFNETDFQKTVDVIKAYFMRKGQHVQFNVFDVNTLRDAQKHPEKYPLLMVRVAGFSVLFTTIETLLQEDIIHRTQHSSH
ncbi:MAG TPA: formate C-acetyltransferase/glycerol dehydratase family glycyl radical enzyme [Peptococcaceae bacterium]|nr:formate C-acetyltransferase/glycerol dehydratase family glycyl radical enzyme [Peptococcaceae bacterium]